MNAFPSPQSLSGPALLPEGATHLLVCLHGFGADGNDLAALARPLQAALSASGLESVAFAFPDAPSSTTFGQGRQWFYDMGWTFRDPEGLQRTLPLLNSYLHDLLQRTGIPPENMVLAGFSQGAMTILGLLPQLQPQPGGVVALSGSLTMPPTTRCPNPMPVLVIHGTEDDVLPADRSVEAADWLEQRGHAVTLRLQEGLGHGIDGAVLAELVVWLTQLWGKADALSED